MENAKHTPGPWGMSLTKRDESWPGLYTMELDVLTYGMDGEEGIYLDNPADAHLITAAPELFEGAKLALKTTGGSANWNGETKAFLEIFEKAIAKVEGCV